MIGILLRIRNRGLPIMYDAHCAGWPEKESHRCSVVGNANLFIAGAQGATSQLIPAYESRYEYSDRLHAHANYTFMGMMQV